MSFPQALTVTIPDGVHFMVMGKDEPIPTPFSLMATTAQHKVAIRIAGGCSGMSVDDKAAMLDYFTAAFAGYQGMIMSGATRSVNADGSIDPMVTEVPGVVAAANPGAIALGTAPRTAPFTYVNMYGASGLQIDAYGGIPNLAQSGSLWIQASPEDLLDWDGDLTVYFKLLEYLNTYANFKSCGLVVWNGGGVTKKEVEMALARNWPVILIQGSGRAADELATIPDIAGRGNVGIVSSSNPEELRRALREFGFLQ